jgi:hypothetical protein
MESPPTPDELDLEILAKRAHALDLERQLDRVRIELTTLEKAASLRPRMILSTNFDALVEASERGAGGFQSLIKRATGGRAPGSLSHQWRSILGAMVDQGNRYLSPQSVSTLAQVIGITIGDKTARDRLRRYSEMGFTERNGETYRVSEMAITRFGFGPTPNAIPTLEVETVSG